MKAPTMLGTVRILVLLGLTLACIACGGGGGGGGGGGDPVQGPPPPPPPAADPLTVTVDGGMKQLNFSWIELPGSTHYRLLENPDGHSGFTQVGADIPAGTLTASVAISVHLFDFVNALYIVEGCDASGCTSSTEVGVMDTMLSTIGYFKASNSRDGNYGFGRQIALSADGITMVVGTDTEGSDADGINGDQSDNTAGGAGAVYLFRYDGTAWFQQAYIKSSNSDANDGFGSSLALSADGNTLVVGANGEASNANGIDGDQADNSASESGAVYVFRFDGTDWFQQAYIKASNSEAGDWFGRSLALSGDGNIFAAGAPHECSGDTGINGDQSDNSAEIAGAAYLFRFDGTNWAQTTYFKASNSEPYDDFGQSIALSADGTVFAVGSGGEASNATGIDGDQTDNSAASAGAVYVFRYDGTDWSQQAYVKASNSDADDHFGSHSGQISLSGGGNTMAVSAFNEQSNATGINGDQNNNLADRTGAAYVFHYDGTDWLQTAYIKASNSGDAVSRFGWQLALSNDGATLAVGVQGENGCAAGVGGDPNNNGCGSSGAVYLFHVNGTNWVQKTYVKSSNPEGGTVLGDGFGAAGIALSANGSTLAVAGDGEDSNATGIDGDQNNNLADGTGAVYLY